DRRQQIILARDAIPVLDEIRQEVEYLWFDLDQLGAAPQLAPLEVERVVAEQKAHPGAPNPAHIIPRRQPRATPGKNREPLRDKSGLLQGRPLPESVILPRSQPLADCAPESALRQRPAPSPRDDAGAWA